MTAERERTPRPAAQVSVLLFTLLLGFCAVAFVYCWIAGLGVQYLVFGILTVLIGPCYFRYAWTLFPFRALGSTAHVGDLRIPVASNCRFRLAPGHIRLSPKTSAETSRSHGGTGTRATTCRQEPCGNDPPGPIRRPPRVPASPRPKSDRLMAVGGPSPSRPAAPSHRNLRAFGVFFPHGPRFQGGSATCA